MYFKARSMQAELILYSGKNVTITSFRIFVVFPNEELKFLALFEGTRGSELNSEGVGGGGNNASAV